ncbi:MAG: hypothetical protein IT550_02180 [Novosphingobium sp.]|nr:hypothetical protein [Novosphingobium sp.]
MKVFPIEQSEPAADLTLSGETLVPVTANCGHVFPVPLARVNDGESFACPVCGKVDRFDEADRSATTAELAARQSNGTLDRIGLAIRDFVGLGKSA